MDDAQNFVVTADNGVETAVFGQLGQIAAVFAQGAELGFGVALGNFTAAAQMLNRLQHPLFGNAKLLQNARGGGVAFAQNGQKDVFGGDELIFELGGFALRQFHHGAHAGRVKNLPHATTIDAHFGAVAQNFI